MDNKGIRCAQCNTDNPPGSLICVRCREVLTLARAKEVKLPPSVGKSESASTSNLKYYVICPECHMKTDVQRDNLPRFCTSCGHLFQIGEGILRQSDGSDEQKDQKKTESAVSKAGSSNPQNPMPKASFRKTFLRLLYFRNGVSCNTREVPSTGVVLGKTGEPCSGSDGAVYIYQSSVGWYLRCLVKDVRINNVYCNAESKHSLEDGDLLTLMSDGGKDEVSIRMEIREE